MGRHMLDIGRKGNSTAEEPLPLLKVIIITANGNQERCTEKES